MGLAVRSQPDGRYAVRIALLWDDWFFMVIDLERRTTDRAHKAEPWPRRPFQRLSLAGGAFRQATSSLIVGQ
jgi:hypothetical protein